MRSAVKAPFCVWKIAARNRRGICLAFGLLAVVCAAVVPAMGWGADRGREPRVALADATEYGQLKLVYVPAPGLENDPNVQRLITELNLRGLQQAVPGVPEFGERPTGAPRARFDLLPNWPVGQSAFLLLPNYEHGTAWFMEIARENQPATAVPVGAEIDRMKNAVAPASAAPVAATRYR